MYKFRIYATSLTVETEQILLESRTICIIFWYYIVQTQVQIKIIVMPQNYLKYFNFKIVFKKTNTVTPFRMTNT